MPVSPVCSCLSCPTHRGAVERPACGFYPSSSMTDAQWALLEPLLPPPGNTGGRGGRPAPGADRGGDRLRLGARRGHRARPLPRLTDAGKRVNGRKRHLAVDTGGLLLAVVVTAAGIQDRDGALRLLTALRAKFATIA